MNIHVRCESPGAVAGVRPSDSAKGTRALYCCFDTGTSGGSSCSARRTRHVHPDRCWTLGPGFVKHGSSTPCCTPTPAACDRQVALKRQHEVLHSHPLLRAKPGAALAHRRHARALSLRAHYHRAACLPPLGFCPVAFLPDDATSTLLFCAGADSDR